MVMDYCSAQSVLHLSSGSVSWDELHPPPPAMTLNGMNQLLNCM